MAPDRVQLDLWMAYRPRALWRIGRFERCILGTFIFIFCVFFAPFAATPGLIGLAGKAVP
jgi:hypothetical protein